MANSVDPHQTVPSGNSVDSDQIAPNMKLRHYLCGDALYSQFRCFILNNKFKPFLTDYLPTVTNNWAGLKDWQIPTTRPISQMVFFYYSHTNMLILG